MGQPLTPLKLLFQCMKKRYWRMGKRSYTVIGGKDYKLPNCLYIQTQDTMWLHVITLFYQKFVVDNGKMQQEHSAEDPKCLKLEGMTASSFTNDNVIVVNTFGGFKKGRMPRMGQRCH